MTREEVKALLSEIGVKVEGLGDRAVEKIQEKVDSEKEKLDTETRRKVRAFWLPVGFALGVFVTLAFQFAL